MDGTTPMGGESTTTSRPPIRIFISTGEVSGDLQGSLLIEALKQQAAAQGLELDILALGGDRMAAAGASLLGHTTAIGSIGIFESLPFVVPTLTVQKRAKVYLKQNPPDLVVLIDYMGPNIALCNYLPTQLPGVPVVYYIAPQEWVWALNSYNTDRIVAAAKRVLAIFPEEARYYEGKGAQVTWVGHPLVDRMRQVPDRTTARAALGIPEAQPMVVLLPASRRQEIKYLLPVMAEAARRIQAQVADVHFWIPLALETYRQPIEQAIQQYGLRATVLADPPPSEQPASPQTSRTLQALAAADLAITKSGTVNLEIALLNVPQVVLYKVNPVTAWILERVLKFSVPFVSPPNLIEMKPIVPELLQYHATPEAITQEALDLLLNPTRRQKMLDDYADMQQALGEPGVCDRAAQEILSLVLGTTRPPSASAAEPSD